jgi:hypothetical protein
LNQAEIKNFFVIFPSIAFVSFQLMNNKAFNGKKAIAHIPACSCVFILHYWIGTAENSRSGYDYHRYSNQGSFDSAAKAGNG